MIANSEIQKFFTKEHGDYIDLPEDSTKQNQAPFRIKIINLIALILTVLVIFRLIYLNTVSNNFLSNQIDTRVKRTQVVTSMRGTITDRNGNALAVSTPVASIWVDPSNLDDLTSEQIKEIASILEVPVKDLNTKLNDKNKTFVYLRRAVSPEQAEQIKNLEIDGIYNIKEYKRFYPSGEVTAHVVGFTNIDDKGSEGVEFANDKLLQGKNGSQQIIRDRQGHVVEYVGNGDPAVNGKNIELSIDNRIQEIAYDALKNQVEKTHAIGGSAVVLDAKTGEVLSMVNIPTYNPNNRDNATLDMLRNRAAIDLYEPGSTMKPFVAAKALDDGLVTPETVFNTMPYHVGPKLIRDTHDHPKLTVSQIIEKSSDVGISKIAFKYKPKDLWTYDDSLGFGQKVGTHFPGEAKGIMHPWQNWRPLDQASMSYGYAISVSLMQMARAYTLFTNNGCLLPLTFYKNANGSAPECKQIIKPGTATEMRDILSKVTEEGNTGILAQVDGYTTAGKTGTAHKAAVHGYYSNKYVGSFVGFAPVNNPKVVIAVMINEPHGAYYGGVVAAPVFSAIAGPTLHLLGVAPDKK